MEWLACAVARPFPHQLAAMSYTFTRAERLKSRKLIGAVFAGRQSVTAWPVRLVWLARPVEDANAGPAPVQVAFAVPRKHLRRAVDRNKVKRRLREAWRLHKHELYRAMERRGCSPLAVIVLYSAREVLPWHQIEPAMVKAMKRLVGAACREKNDEQ